MDEKTCRNEEKVSPATPVPCDLPSCAVLALSMWTFKSAEGSHYLVKIIGAASCTSHIRATPAGLKKE